MTDEGTSSRSSASSNANAYVDVTGTNVPIITINAYKDPQEKPVKLPKLPSNRYRYTTWHELRDIEITGNELNNPRVRKGPDVKDKIFYTIKDEQGKQLHHGKKGKERKEYEKKMENWENSQGVNLSYQELADRYQVDHFIHTLKRLIRAEKIQLLNNNIEDLSKVTFPACTVLNLNINVFTSFTKLPKCPHLKVLHLSDNSIKSFSGLENLRKSGLVAMDLKRNPICFMEHYRQRVFQILPDLEELDSIPRMTSDIAGDLPRPGSCILS